MAIIKGKKYTSYRDIHKKMYPVSAEYRKGYDSMDAECSLYEELIRMRKEKKITQKELAEKLGTFQSSVARFESGTYSPSFDFVSKLAGALGLRLRLTK
jgi:ribosome-binding protein aMBF1 (putative translation factor)